MIKRLKSISSIQKVFCDTNRSPVVVLADDFNEYVCKHTRHTPASYLINELLANRFLKFWNLKVPEVAFVKINPEHLKPRDFSAKLQPVDLHVTTLGFEYLINSFELNQLITSFESSKSKKIFARETDLLKIALFDIWMANEDRHQKNFNLLIENDKQTELNFIPIDHEMIFNTGNLDKGLVELTEDESLITSTLFNQLILKQSKNKSVINISDLEKQYYFYIDKCFNHLDEILNDIPPDWKIDSPSMKYLLLNNLFSEVWKQKALKHFIYLLQIQQR